MVEVAFEQPAPVTATMTRAIDHHRITHFIELSGRGNLALQGGEERRSLW